MFPRLIQRDQIKTSRNGSADGFSHDGSRQDSGRGDVVASTERKEGDMERLPISCFVLLAPRGKPARNEQPVTNEGGLIRFALGGSNDRE
jgi:hypothetical protein